MEIWKPIPNCKYYQISNLGKIKNLDNKYAKRTVSSKGYFRITLINDENKHVRYDIHRLMAEIFLEKPITDKKLCVNHKNGIKKDNRLTNLEWCTYSENINHAIKLKLSHPGKYQQKNKIKNIEENIIFENAIDAAKWVKNNFNIDANIYTISGNIRRCCKHGKPKAYKYNWKYI